MKDSACFFRSMGMEESDTLTQAIIGAAIEVHRHLGPGLLESAYRRSLSHELNLRRIQHVPEINCPITYKDLFVDDAYRIDLFVEGRVVVELKAVERLTEVHEAQLFTYLRFQNCQVGLLMNFRSRNLSNSCRRLVLEQ